MNEIESLTHGNGASVLLLGRYEHLEPDNMAELSGACPNLRVNYRTAHRSNGLEADFVVVVDMVTGRFGFLCEIVDDPTLDLVLNDDETFEGTEERRQALSFVRIWHRFLASDRPAATTKCLANP